ncbi:hypothetical protein ABW20_dc0107742 [Dactylellina cionopaga]|nr:hypothetical protein ABW20_dc0107742 [Dactylellina cionopaga]
MNFNRFGKFEQDCDLKSRPQSYPLYSPSLAECPKSWIDEMETWREEPDLTEEDWNDPYKVEAKVLKFETAVKKLDSNISKYHKACRALMEALEQEQELLHEMAIYGNLKRVGVGMERMLAKVDAREKRREWTVMKLQDQIDFGMDNLERLCPPVKFEDPNWWI